MISAKEARGKSVERIGQIVNEQLELVEKGVLQACEAGKFSFECPEELREETVKQLCDMGYNVEDQFIEWEFVIDEEESKKTDESSSVCDVLDSDEDEVEGKETEDENQVKEPETETLFDDEEEAEQNDNNEAEEAETETLFDDEEESEPGDNEEVAEEAKEAVDEIDKEIVVDAAETETTEETSTDFVLVTNSEE